MTWKDVHFKWPGRLNTRPALSLDRFYFRLSKLQKQLLHTRYGTVLFLVTATEKEWSYKREKNLSLGYQFLAVIPESLNLLTWLASLS